MAKIIFFLFFLAGVMLYPVFIGNEKYESKPVFSSQKIPNVVFEKGRFFLYDKNLSKVGNFKTLEIYKNEYVSYAIKIKDILKNESYEAEKTLFKNDIITGFDVVYKNEDLTLLTDKAVYDKETKILSGEKFKLFAKDFKGFGENFEIDNNHNIYAQNIIYYLKVKK